MQVVITQILFKKKFYFKKVCLLLEQNLNYHHMDTNPMFSELIGNEFVFRIIKCTFPLDLHIHMNRELRGHSERSFRCVWFYVTLLELLVCNARPCTLFRHLARLILSFLLTAAGTSGALCAWGGWHLDGLGPGLS